MSDFEYHSPSKLFFDDPRHLQQAANLECSRLCSYLIALAAVQRGLQVEFFGSTEMIGGKIRESERSSPKPRFIRIKGEGSEHVFDYSAGDLTSRDSARMADNKMQSKVALSRKGVPVPPGGAFHPRDKSKAIGFLRSSKADRFLFKPIKGSFAIGVVCNLKKNQAMRHLMALSDDKGYMLEEHISGEEYRVYVVDGKVAGAWLRSGAFVVGDGKKSILELIEVRNELRAINPQMKHQIIDANEARAYLKGTRVGPSSVPRSGLKVKISNGLNSRSGGLDVDMFGQLPQSVVSSAVGACSALGLPNAGVDVIKRGDTAFVLEANPKANIGKHSFPETGRGSGNTVAEAIIDLYFPSSVSKHRDLSRAPDVQEINAAFRLFGEKTLHKVRVVDLK